MSLDDRLARYLEQEAARRGVSRSALRETDALFAAAEREDAPYQYMAEDSTVTIRRMRDERC